MKNFICGFAAGALTGVLAVYIFKKYFRIVKDEPEKIPEEKTEEPKLDIPYQTVSMGHSTGTVWTVESVSTANASNGDVIYGSSNENFHMNVHSEPTITNEPILPDYIFTSSLSVVGSREMREELWENSHTYEAFDEYDIFEYEWYKDTGHLYYTNGTMCDEDFELFDGLDFEEAFGDCYNLCERIILAINCF